MTDQLQPNVLTIDADGRIGARFSGHVSAEGIDLPAGQGLDSQVLWRDVAGALVAMIFGYEIDIGPPFPRTTGLGMQAAAPDATGQSSVQLDASNAGGSETYAQLLVTQTNNGQDPTFVAATAGGHQSRLVDSQGRASFPVLAGGYDTVAIDSGSAAVQFNNGNVSAGTTVSHRLGRTPAAILITGRDAPGFVIWYETFARGPSTFYVASQYVAAITYRASFDWLAIG